MKKLGSLALAATLAMGCMPLSVSAADITVTTNGAPVAFTDAKPYINTDSRTLVPLRAIAEALDLDVTWDDTAKTATFADKDTPAKAVFTIGESKYTLYTNDSTWKDVEMDTAAVITEERTYAPARYLAEAFGYNVAWDGANTTVAITPSYEITATKVEIPARSTKIQATLVLPKVAEGVKVPLVALVHGHGGSQEENGGFTDVAESLAKAGIATIRMDFPGCGTSTESFQQNTLTNMISDVYTCIEFAQQQEVIDKTKVGLFGYSMGGRISSTIIGEGKLDVDGLVLLAPSVDSDTEDRFLGDKAAWDEKYAVAVKDGFYVHTTPFGQVQELSKAWFEDMAASDPLANADKFTGKAMVIYGEDDTTVAPEISKLAVDAFHAKALDVTGDSHSYSFYNDKPEIRSAIIVNTVNLFLEAFK